MSTARLIDQAYVSTGQVRVVVKNLSGEGGLDAQAAEAALCAADQAKFWEYHDQLMESSYRGDRTVFTPAGLRQLAASIGLDANALGACLDQRKYAQRVNDEAAEARARGVTGTPTFFVNDTVIRGAQPYAAFKAAIDAALQAP